jgi:hypothetical protein
MRGETGNRLIAAHPSPPALATIVTDSAGFVYQTMEGMVADGARFGNWSAILPKGPKK